MIYYSKQDEKAVLYIGLILAPIIAISIWFGVQYNEKQVSSKLASSGITVYCRVDSVYEVQEGRSMSHYVKLDYTRGGKKTQLAMRFDPGLAPCDTLILRRLPDNNAPSFMRIIGCRNNGVDLIRNE